MNTARDATSTRSRPTHHDSVGMHWVKKHATTEKKERNNKTKQELREEERKKNAKSGREKQVGGSKSVKDALMDLC